MENKRNTHTNTNQVKCRKANRLFEKFDCSNGWLDGLKSNANGNKRNGEKNRA